MLQTLDPAEIKARLQKLDHDQRILLTLDDGDPRTQAQIDRMSSEAHELRGLLESQGHRQAMYRRG